VEGNGFVQVIETEWPGWALSVIWLPLSAMLSPLLSNHVLLEKLVMSAPSPK
jgi:hypothetical protein